MRDFSLANGATELLLIRHGDAEHPQGALENDPKTFDLPLTPKGRRQAEALAQRLMTRSIHAMYASPLRRTRETADIVAGKLGLTVVDDVRLREVEIAGAGPVALADLAEIAIAHGGWSHMPGTESSESVRARMRAALDDIVASHAQQRVAVISHAGAMNAFFSALLSLKGDFFFPAGNTSISVVRARDDRRLLYSLNDIAHLENTK